MKGEKENTASFQSDPGHRVAVFPPTKVLDTDNKESEAETSEITLQPAMILQSGTIRRPDEFLHSRPLGTIGNYQETTTPEHLLLPSRPLEPTGRSPDKDRVDLRQQGVRGQDQTAPKDLPPCWRWEGGVRLEESPPWASPRFYGTQEAGATGASFVPKSRALTAQERIQRQKLLVPRSRMS